MRRLLILLVLALTVGLAAPAMAAQGWEDVQANLVPLPAGFTEANTPGAMNGKIDIKQLIEAGGEDADDFSDEEIESLKDSGYARTLLNQESGEVLVLMGFRTNKEREAGAMLKGMLESAAGEDFKKDEASSTSDVHVYKVKAQGFNGQGAVFRKGLYAFMFLTLGTRGDPTKDLAKNLAQQQFDALPAGESTPDDGGPNVGLVLVVLGLIVAGVVALIVTRASRKNKAAGELPPAEGSALYGSGGVDQPGTEQGVAAGHTDVGGPGEDPVGGSRPPDA